MARVSMLDVSRAVRSADLEAKRSIVADRRGALERCARPCSLAETTKTPSEAVG